MRRRNPASSDRKRRAGPPPWPPKAMIEEWRRVLIVMRGCPFGTPFATVADLAANKAWHEGVNMTWAPDAVIVRRLFDDALTPPPLRLRLKPAGAPAREPTGGLAHFQYGNPGSTESPR